MKSAHKIFFGHFAFAALLLSSCNQAAFPKLKAGRIVKTELFFGMNIPTGGMVEQADWATFLSEEITSRFSDGLTVYEARGQWLGADGKIAREPSRVVVLLYPYSVEKENEIKAIITAYKKAFQQEAVMRVDAVVRWGF